MSLGQGPHPFFSLAPECFIRLVYFTVELVIKINKIRHFFNLSFLIGQRVKRCSGR
jgi:hypothetical protein